MVITRPTACASTASMNSQNAVFTGRGGAVMGAGAGAGAEEKFDDIVRPFRILEETDLFSPVPQLDPRITQERVIRQPSASDRCRHLRQTGVVMTTDSTVTPNDPWELVRKLTSWAEATPWVAWLELSGSLGRGAGDERSDVDAGVGVSEPGRLDEISAAVHGFAPLVASMREPFGTDAIHLITVYSGNRQLSLVVMPEQARTGLPPQASALVDKSGRLNQKLERSRWDPDDSRKRHWTFTACLAASDTLKHSARGNRWRALHSLNEARDIYLRLLAARDGVLFPQFGAVSLQNAGQPIPATLNRTLPADLEPRSVQSAVLALMTHLKPFVDEHELNELALTLGLAAG